MALFSRNAKADSTVAERMAAAFEASQKGDYETALSIWGPLAHQGVGRAQNNIGACFSEGLGVDRDPVLAIKWLTAAAESGDAVGQRNLAAAYFKGEGVEEKGYDTATGNCIVAVDPRYFRPAEVETLLGDPSKAKQKLGWVPRTSFKELVSEMMQEDLKGAQRDELVKQHGFKYFNHHE